MRNRNTTIVHDLSHFSSSDGVIRSVPFPNQCLGEAEEWQRSGEPHSSDPSVAFPWQRAEELHSGSSEQQCSTWTMYESCLDEQTQQTQTCSSTVSLTLACVTHSVFCVLQVWRKWRSTILIFSVTLSGPVGDTRGFWYLHHTWWVCWFHSVCLHAVKPFNKYVNKKPLFWNWGWGL